MKEVPKKDQAEVSGGEYQPDAGGGCIPDIFQVPPTDRDPTGPPGLDSTGNA